ncbi:MAG: amidohydrolase [Acidobacteriota bacterium]
MVTRSTTVLRRARVQDGESWIAIEGERILAVGAERDGGAPSGKEVDVEGRRVLPSFVDAHGHLKDWALDRTRVRVAGETDHDAMVAKVRAFAATLPSGAWLLGGGWDKNRTGRLPCAADLAGVDRPVMLDSRDGHALWCNHVALELAGISRESPDPDGGAIVRDLHREPTGVLYENARRAVQRLVPPPDEAEVERVLRLGLRELRAMGIAEVHDCSYRSADGVWATALRLDAAGELPLRIAAAVPGDALDAALAMGMRTGWGSDRLRIGALKQLADGTLGSQTAAMEQPFCGGTSSGIMCIPPTELRDNVRRAASGGIASWIHAVGDRCLREALAAIADAEAAHPGLPHRVEHAQLSPPELIARAREIGVTMSVQPTHLLSDRDLATRYWGERARHSYAYGSMLRAGIPLAFGSDMPVEAPEPWAGVRAAVLRARDGDAPFFPDEAMDLQSALRAYSAGGADAGPWRGQKGRIAPGQLADLIVVDPDPEAIAPRDLSTISVHLHLIGGREA